MSTKISSATHRENTLSLGSQIAKLDQEMQMALESGSLAKARKLAEEQERLLSLLMLVQEER
jgi:hypothetical protein